MEKIIQRSFILGDQWLYYKIYCGVKTADMIISKYIWPLGKKLEKDFYIDKWFFIRYFDPDSHLRVRFHIIQPKSVSNVIERIYPILSNLLNKSYVWKIQTDTYTRELERYGCYTITITEELFFHDSLMVSSIISNIDTKQNKHNRWFFALKAIDSYLSCFDLQLQKKKDFMKFLKGSFAVEFDMNRELNKKISRKFREYRPKINEIMSVPEKSDISYMLPPLIKFKEKVYPICNKIKTIVKQHKEVPIEQLLSSYIHMFMNRLFRSRQRVHELVIYDFLYRYYDSKLARLKYNPQPTV